MQDFSLKPLRAELQLAPGPHASSGEPSWILIDPLRNKYIQIDAIGHALLSVWNTAPDVDALLAAANEKYDLQIDIANAKAFVQFTRENALCDDPSDDAWRRMHNASRSTRNSLVTRALHGYLFFQVPLVNPQRFLDRTLPFVSVFLKVSVLKVVIAMGLVGLFLISRQWNVFLASAVELQSVSGALKIAVTIAVIKALHEMGHAYAASYFGCRVPVIGVAFMLMTPMVYADVSDAWRLTDQRKRLLIDLAGVIVEMGIACIACLAWSFLPDGLPRSIAFLAATTSLFLSLAVNLNPLMRFDGYYVLADLLRAENLQARAFALGKWRIRRLLFAPRLPAPEQLPRGRRRVFVVYAFCVWIYRAILYTGIALLVYGYFFKLLGIALFAFEIWYFLLWPVVSEIKEWRKLDRSHVSVRRTAVVLSGGLAMVTLAFLPMPSQVFIPAVIGKSDVYPVYPQTAGQIVRVSVAPGDAIGVGSTIAVLRSPDLDRKIEQIEASIRALQLRYNRIISDDEDRSVVAVIVNELSKLEATRDGLLVEKEKLTVKGTGAGYLLELDHEIQTDLWVSPDTWIATVGRNEPNVRGYVAEDDLGAIALGSRGVFVPEQLELSRADVSVTKIETSGVSIVDLPELASVNDGPVSVQREGAQLSATKNYYLVYLTLADAEAHSPRQIVRGTVVLSGRYRSLASRVFRSVASGLIREGAF